MADELTQVHDEPAMYFAQAMAGPDVTDLVSYRLRRRGKLFRILVSRELYGQQPDGSEDWRWHVSVSLEGSQHTPTWADLVACVHQARPGVGFTVAIPPPTLWMSLHPGVLHAVEVRDPNQEAQWRAEAQRGQRPDG